MKKRLGCCKQPLILAVSIAVASWMGSAAEPAAARAPNHISVPAGRLGDAVISLAAQTGVNIGVRDQRLATLSVKPVSGAKTVKAALTQMLRGLPAKALSVGGNGWIVVSAPIKTRPITPPRPKPVPLPPAPPAPVIEPPMQDIIVTATKRTSALGDLPVAVTSIGGGSFTATPDGANGIALTAQSVAISSTHFGSGRNKLFVRGISDSGFSGPTQATVGQYLGEARINYSAPDPDLRLHDLDSIEILEGPQGTLYGSGSMGGIIRAVPNAPDFAEASGRIIATGTATQGGAQGGEAVAIVNLPLVKDVVAVRANAYRAREGGYVDDSLRLKTNVNESNITGGRAALSARLGGSWKADILGVVQTIDTRDAQYAELGKPGLSRPSAIAQPFDQKYAMASGSIVGDIGRVKLIGTLGHVANRSREIFNADREERPFARFEQSVRARITSAEIRANLELGNRQYLLIGASALTSHNQNQRLFEVLLDLNYQAVSRSHLHEFTLFGEGAVAVTPHLTATLGGRVSTVNVSGNQDDSITGPITEGFHTSAQRKQTIAAPSAALLLDISRNVRSYLRYQQGYRPGGLGLQFGNADFVRSDRISTAEWGVRVGQSNVSRLSGSIALSYARWRHIQADVADFSGIPFTINIGNGEITTAQAAVQLRATDGLSFEAAMLHNWSRLTDPSFTLMSFDPGRDETIGGSTLPNVADKSARLAMNYNGKLGKGWEWSLVSALRYTGRSRLGIGSRFDRMQGGFTQSNLLLRFRRNDLSVYLASSNLFNDKSSRFAIGNPVALDIDTQFVPQRPRTLTIGVDYAF